VEWGQFIQDSPGKGTSEHDTGLRVTHKMSD